MKGLKNMVFCPPEKKCKKCLRLVKFRADNEEKFPTYYNGAVPSFGDTDAEILVVGLAPGLNGANRTGRPFTNDYAGDVLYPALKKHGFAKGNYAKKAVDKPPFHCHERKNQHDDTHEDIGNDIPRCRVQKIKQLPVHNFPLFDFVYSLYFEKINLMD